MTAKKHLDEEQGETKGYVEKPVSAGITWDNEDDPYNPMNWKKSKKWRNLLIISAMAFITYACLP